MLFPLDVGRKNRSVFFFCFFFLSLWFFHMNCIMLRPTFFKCVHFGQFRLAWPLHVCLFFKTMLPKLSHPWLTWEQTHVGFSALAQTLMSAARRCRHPGAGRWWSWQRHGCCERCELCQRFTQIKCKKQPAVLRETVKAQIPVERPASRALLPRLRGPLTWVEGKANTAQGQLTSRAAQAGL